jgi:hypothetical protein
MWNLPQQHTIAAARNELVAVHNNSCMLAGEFKVMWDTLHNEQISIKYKNQSSAVAVRIQIYNILRVP